MSHDPHAGNAPAEIRNCRCCFNEMIPDVLEQLTVDFDRIKHECSECHMVWCVTRLQLSMIFSPLGIRPLIEVNTQMPKGMSS